MIDYIKLLIEGANIERLLQNKELDFIVEVSESTGVISTKKTAHYNFCKIIIYDSGIVIFSGSIHKLHNSLNQIVAPNYQSNNYKGFNGNKFDLNGLNEVRNHLSNLLDCKPEQMQIRSIEIGVNVIVQFNIALFLKGLLYHKNKTFDYKFDRSFAIVIHDRYNVKIYDKSKQYNIKQKTLRFELKYNKLNEIKSIGIRTFSDINQHTLKEAYKLLVTRFDEVVYYDNTIYLEGLNKKQLLKLKDYSNPRYWIDVLEPKRRDRPKKDLKRIIQNNSMNLHSIIRKEILENWVMIHRKS